MRVAPLGVLWAHDSSRLVRAVVEQARVTHHDPRCAAGAVAIAAASMVAYRSGQLDPPRCVPNSPALRVRWTRGRPPQSRRWSVGWLWIRKRQQHWFIANVRRPTQAVRGAGCRARLPAACAGVSTPFSGHLTITGNGLYRDQRRRRHRYYRRHGRRNRRCAGRREGSAAGTSRPAE